MAEEGQNQLINLEEMREEGEDDRISPLPDCLLLEILSRLPSTRDAIITGTLSKRWEHLWAWVPTLIFTPPPQYAYPNSRSDFALTVDETLTQCRQLKLKKFRVLTLYDIQYESQFNKWIQYAMRCNVEDLDLAFTGRENEFLLEQSIFISSCLTDLRLANCKLSPNGAIGWENLRSLFLYRVNLDEDLIVKIVSGSPLLETFVLEIWELKSEAVISAHTSLSLTQCPQLKHLKTFNVCAIIYRLFGSQIPNWIRYAIRCNVKELKLGFPIFGSESEFMLDQTLFTSSCFTDLTLDGCMLNPVGAISWKNLRSLCIAGYWSLDEDLIENILSGSPVLETLKLDQCRGYRRVDVTSKSVKNLELHGHGPPYGESEADALEINAPNILSLTIKGGTFSCKPFVLNVPSLVKAYLNYTCTKLEDRMTLTTPALPKEEEQEMLKECIINLGHVKELKIGRFCFEVFSCLEANGFVFPSNVKLTLVKGKRAAVLA